MWDWERVIGLLLREDYAPMLHKNLPHAERDSFSEPADLAHMDTLCAYPAGDPAEAVRRRTSRRRPGPRRGRCEKSRPEAAAHPAP
ncbi:hypothetical protein Slala04_67910 [Streptomyces lavendulae subsp. lavendulae]|nr:hypothetical protein Slala04_67910 [Streptomyces lavendulae subsp. lavendulae]